MHEEAGTLTITDAETDQRIIKAIQNGDREAFAELYDRHNAWLMAVAYRILQNRRDAEDLLHDLFLEIWKKSANYDPKRGAVRSWLAVKIRSRALDRIRRHNTAKKYALQQFPSDVESELSTNDTSRAVDHILARRMLDQLSPVQRTVIELSYFRGLSCQEIATHCQMPLGTVKSGLLRAIQFLRREFNSSKVPEHAS